MVKKQAVGGDALLLNPFSTWELCADLAEDPVLLFKMLRIRLVQVAMGQGASAHIRAAEMLMSMGHDVPDEDLEVSDHERAVDVAVRYLRAFGYDVSEPEGPRPD